MNNSFNHIADIPVTEAYLIDEGHSWKLNIDAADKMDKMLPYRFHVMEEDLVLGFNIKLDGTLFKKWYFFMVKDVQPDCVLLTKTQVNSFFWNFVLFLSKLPLPTTFLAKMYLAATKRAFDEVLDYKALEKST